MNFVGFGETIVSALSADLSSKAVKSRKQAGRSLSYIEGWWAIAEANRIFGFDGWTRETVEIKCVSEKPRRIGEAQREGWGVTYTCRVRIDAKGVIREGTGAGHGIDVDLGAAHESAIKEAETDAMKRALMTFGWPFGLALYDKGQEHVGDAKPAPAPIMPSDEQRPDEWKGPLKVTNLKNKLRDLASAVRACEDPEELAGMESDHKEILEQAEHDLPDWFTAARKAINERAALLMEHAKYANAN
jgi:DNA recombination protein Rad52